MTRIGFSQPDALLGASLLLAGVAFVLLRRRTDKPELLFLKGAAMAAILILISRPELIRVPEQAKPVLAIALDVSPSMKLANRLPAAEEFVRDHRKELSGFSDLKLYTFADSAQELRDPQSAGTVQAGEETDIPKSVWEIRRESGQSLGGILLISDGNHTAGSLPAEWMNGLGVPVFTLAPGTEKKIRDLAIPSVRVTDFAFKDTPTEIAVELKALGLAGKTATITLSEHARTAAELARRSVPIRSDDETLEVKLRFTPAARGTFEYTVEARPLEGEITLANNRRKFSLDVIREKLRILYLCGQPGPEYAFLRQILKNDPMVELVSFVILRNPENIALVPEQDLALIPFPVQDLFSRELFSFDALILENFTYRKFGFTGQYLENIRRWVLHSGGGLLMTGGENSFGKGGWGGSPVEELLPVTLESPSDAGEDGLFRLRIMKYDHPLTILSEDAAKNRSLWEQMPELDGSEPLKPAPGADILATDPRNGSVVVAAWNRGKGRVAAVGSETTWRWSMQSPTPEPYTRFWKNMIRFITRSQEQNDWNFQFDRSEYFSGQEFEFQMRGDLNPGETDLSVLWTDAAGGKRVMSVEKRGARVWSGKGTFPAPGLQTFSVTLSRNGIREPRSVRSVEVSASLAREEASLDCNVRFLRETAAASRGEYFTPDSFSPSLLQSKLKKADTRVSASRLPLWNSPWLYGILMLLMILEWGFRKYRGMW